MAVIGVLIALLMPSLSSVRETARRVVCASNVRQHGLGMAMYADDYHGFLPPAKYGNPTLRSRFMPHTMMVLRLDEAPGIWDGLGVLYVSSYLEAPGVFYCPSHHGDHLQGRYLAQWAGDIGGVVGNYHYRGVLNQRIDQIPPAQAMATDGMASRSDYNHKVGSNVLRMNLTVGWFSDAAGRVASNLPDGDRDPEAASKVEEAWQAIDNPGRINGAF